MYVHSLSVSDFRNYTDQRVRFDAGLNIIEGHNTAGKTNLVEAVYLCGVGKSPRAGKDKELIRLGCDNAHITLVVQKKYRQHRIDINIGAKGKTIVIDGVGIQRMADLMGVLNVIYFSPDEMKIVKEDPTVRRRFLNIGLCQQNKQYFAALAKYNRVLENRNALLRTATDYATLVQQLPAWDAQLAEEGATIITLRQDFMQSLQQLADPIHRSIAGEGCDLSLGYTPYPTGRTAIRDALLSALGEAAPKEWNTRYTLVGPHRDDFAIVSEQKDLRTFGSQGQQRTAALALKLAEIAYFQRNTGEMPVLLLDDVLSELDASRRSALLRATQGIQTLLTCTEFSEDISIPAKHLHIAHGQVIEE